MEARGEGTPSYLQQLVGPSSTTPLPSHALIKRKLHKPISEQYAPGGSPWAPTPPQTIWHDSSPQHSQLAKHQLPFTRQHRGSRTDPTVAQAAQPSAGATGAQSFCVRQMSPTATPPPPQTPATQSRSLQQWRSTPQDSPWLWQQTVPPALALAAHTGCPTMLRHSKLSVQGCPRLGPRPCIAARVPDTRDRPPAAHERWLTSARRAGEAPCIRCARPWYTHDPPRVHRRSPARSLLSPSLQ